MMELVFRNPQSTIFDLAILGKQYELYQRTMNDMWSDRGVSPRNWNVMYAICDYLARIKIKQLQLSQIECLRLWDKRNKTVTKWRFEDDQTVTGKIVNYKEVVPLESMSTFRKYLRIFVEYCLKKGVM